MRVNDLVLYLGDLFRVEQVGVPSEVLEGELCNIQKLNFGEGKMYSLVVPIADVQTKGRINCFKDFKYDIRDSIFIKWIDVPFVIVDRYKQLKRNKIEDCYDIMGLNKRRIMITVTEEDIVRRVDECIK